MVIALWLSVVGCTGESPGVVFPAPGDLPAVEAPPDPFVAWSDGEPVETADDWAEVRRPEIDALFRHYVYGEPPAAPGVRRIRALPESDSAGGVLHQWVVDHGFDGTPPFTLAVWAPPGDGPFPVVLGLNKCGNTSVLDDDALLDGGGYADPTCTGAAGERASYWALDAALAAGVAVATVHQSDFAPDDADSNAALYAWPADDASPWGAVGMWAHGLSRAVDVLLRADVVDAEQIWVMGHSRRGKAALWAAARDERIAGVWAHQSGTLGAALSRSYDGEPVASITTLFPHWFSPLAEEFGDDEVRFPVDQHLLVALVAPRRVLVVDGQDDAWADPAGAAQAVALAAPVFTLLDADAPTHLLRPGGHEVTPADWELILPYLAR